MLANLNRCKDPHLVKLILTMQLEEWNGASSFWLFFPLADSNLAQFWQNKLEFSDDMRETYAGWLAGQFHGLAQALSKLHDLNMAAEIKGKKGDPSYGIHGDIKPENILWYKKWRGREDDDVAPQQQQHQPNGIASEGSTAGTAIHTDADKKGKWPFGVLQLADFGITRLHRTGTRSNVAMRQATKTYAPPELEVGPGGCSRSFDIWSLGCVFLEFLCWLVQAGPGNTNPVRDFHEERKLGGENLSLDGIIMLDSFYQIVSRKRMLIHGETTFMVNRAVTSIVSPDTFFWPSPY